MNKLLFTLLMIFGATCVGQTPPPQDQSRHYLTIITHDDWAKYPAEARLIENLKKEPMLKVAKACHFNHYTPSDPMYKERYAAQFPQSTFPGVLLQLPSGGALYKSSAGNVPTSSVGLFAEMKYYRDLVVKPSPAEQMEQSDDEPELNKRPWLNRDSDEVDEEFDETLPDSWEIFGGKMPLRDTIAGGAAMMQAIVAIGFLLAICIVAAIVLKIIG